MVEGVLAGVGAGQSFITRAADHSSLSSSSKCEAEAAGIHAPVAFSRAPLTYPFAVVVVIAVVVDFLKADANRTRSLTALEDLDAAARTATIGSLRTSSVLGLIVPMSRSRVSISAGHSTRTWCGVSAAPAQGAAGTSAVQVVALLTVPRWVPADAVPCGAEPDQCPGPALSWCTSTAAARPSCVTVPDSEPSMRLLYQPRGQSLTHRACTVLVTARTNVVTFMGALLVHR